MKKFINYKNIKILITFIFILVMLVGALFPEMTINSYAIKEDYTDRYNGNLDNVLKYGKEQQAKAIVDNLYGDLNKEVEDVMNILAMEPDSNTVVWEMIRNVSEALVPVGFAIASVFILLAFLNKAMMFQLRNHEDLAKILLFMLLAKVVLMSSFEILGFIYSASANIIKTASVNPSDIVSDVDKELLVSQIASMNPLEMLAFQISTMPMTVLMIIIKVLIKAIAYGRIFEIYIFTALAPLPLATLASPDLHQIAKKFIQSYIGVCLQGFVMILACVIFTALSVQFIDPTLQDSPTGCGTGFLMASIVLLYVLVRSGSWGKQIAGLI